MFKRISQRGSLEGLLTVDVCCFGRHAVIPPSGPFLSLTQPRRPEQVQPPTHTGALARRPCARYRQHSRLSLDPAHSVSSAGHLWDFARPVCWQPGVQGTALPLLGGPDQDRPSQGGHRAEGPCGSLAAGIGADSWHRAHSILCHTPFNHHPASGEAG